jgi:predicted GH43/DUF377 family glycosyl hydrolase
MEKTISFVKTEKSLIKTNLKKYKIICPKVIKFKNKLYRMYFSQDKKLENMKNITIIKSAISNNCVNWYFEKGERIKTLSNNNFKRLLSPHVIKISKNLYRMYFEARNLDKRGFIKSAISNDGLNWEEEKGIRIGNFDNFSYGTPFCLKVSNNKFELYVEKRTKKKRDIWMARSSDGLLFNEKKIVQVIKQEKRYERYSIGSPDIIYSKNYYYMYYSGWKKYPIRGHILCAYSKNRKVWKKYKSSILTPGGKYDHNHCSEPSVIKIGKKLKIFYEGCDKNNNWRILCTQ